VDDAGGRTFEVAGIAATSTVATVTIKLASGLWVGSARNALRGETEAWRARAELERQKREGLPFEAANDELDAALAAIGGAAFAIDGFYGSIAPWIAVPPHLLAAWERNRTARDDRILESLKLAFRLGPAGARWQNDLPWLFALRNGNVHYAEEFFDPEPHPVMGNVPRERTLYTAENATKAVDLMLDVFATCSVDRLRPKSDPQLIDWRTRWEPIIEQLRLARQRPRAA
jgi:hypothetical protein